VGGNGGPGGFGGDGGVGSSGGDGADGGNGGDGGIGGQGGNGGNGNGGALYIAAGTTADGSGLTGTKDEAAGGNGGARGSAGAAGSGGYAGEAGFGSPAGTNGQPGKAGDPGRAGARGTKGSSSGTVVAGGLVPLEALSLAPEKLPKAAVKHHFSVKLEATGGTARLAWAAFGLPAGLTLNATTGLLSGTPTTAGTFLVEIYVADSRTPVAGIGGASYKLVVAT
jgi:hypothetical protein